MRACIALSRKISTNFSGSCPRPCACACTSASSDSQSCHRKCPREQAARGARCRGQAQGRMEAGVVQEGRRRQRSTGGIQCHCSRQAGGGAQGCTADSIQSVLFSTSSMLLPSSVGTSLSVQTIVTSCVKKPGCHNGPKSEAVRKFALLEAASFSAPLTLLQWERESHLCSVPSDPTCTSRIADVICNLFALRSRQ